MANAISYQDTVLKQVRREGLAITVYLVSGYQIRGTLKAFDPYVLIIESDGKQQMVYKHAIATIVPSRTIKLNQNLGEQDE